MPAPQPARTPWITAAVAGVVLAALLLVYFAFLLPARDDKNDPSNAVGGLSNTEKQAVVAAGTETANLLSFRRAQFSRTSPGRSTARPARCATTSPARRR